MALIVTSVRWASSGVPHHHRLVSSKSTYGFRTISVRAVAQGGVGPLLPAVTTGARHSIISVYGWTCMSGSFADGETEA